MLLFSYMALFWSLAFCAACGEPVFSESRSENALARSAPCAKWSAVAGDVGCELPSECTIPDRCANEARALIDCIAEDLSQCICEDDGDLNCEGAHKVSEGPASCIDEHRSVEACLGPVGEPTGTSAPDPSQR